MDFGYFDQVRYLGEYGFRVLVVDGWCRRNSIQKTDLRKFFPQVNSATGKSHPNTFQRYMRRAAEIQFGSIAAAQYQISYLWPAKLLLGNQLATCCASSGQFGGDYRAAGLYCAASLRQVAPCRGVDGPQLLPSSLDEGSSTQSLVSYLLALLPR